MPTSSASLDVTAITATGGAIETALAKTMLTATDTIGILLTDAGWALLGIFLGIHLVLTGIRWSLAGNSEMVVKDATKILLNFGLASFFLTNYQWMASQFAGGFDLLATQASFSTTGSFIKGLLGIGGEMIKTVWENITKLMSASLESSFSNILMSVVYILILFATLLFTVYAIITMCAMVIAATVAFAVGIAIAPVMIPFIMAGVLEGIFWSWVGMMFSLGFVKLMAAVIGMLGLELFKVSSNDIVTTTGVVTHGWFAKNVLMQPASSPIMSINLGALFGFMLALFSVYWLTKMLLPLAFTLGGGRPIDAGGGAMASAGGGMVGGAVGGAGRAAARATRQPITAGSQPQTGQPGIP